MVKNIFFDLDGVLTTDKTGAYTTSKYFAKKLGANLKEIFEYKSKFNRDTDSGKISDLDVWKKTCEKLGYEFVLTDLYEAFLSTPIDETMLQYAIKLKDKYNIGIITDNSVRRANTIIEKNNFKNIFDTIVISEDVKCTKNGVEIFKIATQRARVNAEQCIFIDNNKNNIDIANKAGFIGFYFDDQIRDYNKLFKEINKTLNN